MSAEEAAYIRSRLSRIVQDAARTHDQLMEAGGECDGDCGWEKLAQFLQMVGDVIVDQYMECRYSTGLADPVRRYNLERAIGTISEILRHGPGGEGADAP